MVEQVEPGDQIGQIDCPACSIELAVRVNKNLCAYAMCQNVLSEQDGKKERCFFRFTYGREKSKALIEEFLAREDTERDIDVQIYDGEGREEKAGEAEDNAVGEDMGREQPGTGGGNGQDGQPAGGIGASIHHFFTGD